MNKNRKELISTLANLYKEYNKKQTNIQEVAKNLVCCIKEWSRDEYRYVRYIQNENLSDMDWTNEEIEKEIAYISDEIREVIDNYWKIISLTDSLEDFVNEYSYEDIDNILMN